MMYTGEQLREIVFPLGGIGTGSVGLRGNGRLADWEIFNSPDKGSINGYSHLAVRAEYPDGKAIVRVLEGDTIRDWMGQYSKVQAKGFGNGLVAETMAGLPHFRSVTFENAFPFAVLTFRDPDFPAVVTLTAFNPFIPLDSENSGLPVAFFNLSVSSCAPGVRFSAAFSLQNPYGISRNEAFTDGEVSGVFLRENSLPQTALGYGDLTLAAIGPATVQEYWYRGNWHDGVITFWKDFSEGALRPRHYDDAQAGQKLRKDHGTIAVDLAPDVCRTFVLSWNCPVRCNDWSPCPDADGKEPTWKNYYATRFASSRDSALYALAHYDDLYRRSDAFRQAFFSSSLDPVLLDAMSATLCVLKSPTVLRLEDGTFWGWEGVFASSGSCEGTCTHVWSYAYALCFLFPDLERTIRNTEFEIDERESGAMDFRTKLPLGRRAENFICCLDGQMASVFKAYREWKISGDTAWLGRHWDAIKRTLAYAWSEENPHAWDRDGDGVLEGRQHHTLDMELFGPSSWLEGMYLAALAAAREMAREFGDPDEEKFAELFDQGKAFLNRELFNGSYYFQKINLHDRSYTDRFDCPGYWNDERGELKYQIGEGSAIDQMLGQWHADLLGLGEIFDTDQCETALRSMMKTNFKPRIGEIANMWRNFAVDDESGTVICDYPGATKPAIPLTYCSECNSGFEYAFAGLLFSRGMTDDGLRVVRAIRDRYDGRKRNPFNEIECGSNYARSMAGFAILPILSGFVFDLPHGTIGFCPRLSGDFRTFFSVGTAWGTYSRRDDGADLILSEGKLTLSAFLPGTGKPPRTVLADGEPVGFRADGDAVRFDEPVTVSRSLVVR